MSSSFDRIDPKLIDVFHDEHDGYPAELAAGDTIDVLKAMCGSAAREFPKSLWIEPKDWADKARDNDKYGTWPINYVDRFTNQNPTHECTCHALRALFEGCRNRQRGVSFKDGPKKNFRYEESAKFDSVWVSVLSIYARANPRQWGGASIRGVLDILCRYGFLPDKTQPKEYGFKHTLQSTAGEGNSNQSRGEFIRESEFPPGHEQTSRWLKADEIIFPTMWEQAVCLVLNGLLYEVGRSGHAIPYAKWNVTEQAMAYTDSYDVVRFDSKRTVQGCAVGGFAIATVTTPDDWSKPAGE